jgi:hypothetical protein
MMLKNYEPDDYPMLCSNPNCKKKLIYSNKNGILEFKLQSGKNIHLQIFGVVKIICPECGTPAMVCSNFGNILKLFNN